MFLFILNLSDGDCSPVREGPFRHFISPLPIFTHLLHNLFYIYSLRKTCETSNTLFHLSSSSCPPVTLVRRRSWRTIIRVKEDLDVKKWLSHSMEVLNLPKIALHCICFHRYVSLFWEIKFFLQRELRVKLEHTLSKGNYNANFLAKRGATDNVQIERGSPWHPATGDGTSLMRR